MIAAAASGLLLNVFTDPFLGYFRNVYIFGQEYTIAKALTKITGGVTFVNSVASTICVVILYLALRPALERANLLPKAQKASEPRPTSNQLPFLSDVLIKRKRHLPHGRCLFVYFFSNTRNRNEMSVVNSGSAARRAAPSRGVFQ